MNEIFADVILFDTTGIPYVGNDIEIKGMGASESQAIFLLEEFAKLNKKVICLNNTKIEKEYNGVLYLPNVFIEKYNFKTSNLILHRNSFIPKNIKHKKCFQWITDNNSYHNLSYYQLADNKKCELITLSQYSCDQYPKDWNKHVINFIIPDWVYNYEIPKTKSDFVYASSLMKGYDSTLVHWIYLKKNYKNFTDKKLNVCLPGYDNPSKDISSKEFNINYFGSLTFKQVVELLAKSEGLFYVNAMTETFCVSAVLAEILKATPYIYCINGYGALKEVLTSDTVSNNAKNFFNDVLSSKKSNIKSKDYSSKIIIDKWLRILEN
jgi:hypothetical protein